MRLLFVLHQFYPEFSGGTERVALNLARSAQRAGHHVQVLACNVNEGLGLGRPNSEIAGAVDYVHDGVPVLLLPRSLLPETADISLAVSSVAVGVLANWMARCRFDVAHVLHAMRMGSAILAAQRCSLPYVITLTDFFTACYRINLINQSSAICEGPQEGRACVRDCLTPPWDEKSLTARYKQASAFLAAAGECVAPSEYVAERFRQSFPALQFRVIPHGIDFLGFSSRSSSGARILGQTRDIRFGYLGSILPQKGLDVLLQAFSKVPSPNLTLRIVGGFYGDTGYHAEIRRLTSADSRVELVGQVKPDEVAEVLDSFDVLCLPSRVPETFSLSLNEAAVAGVPSLVSDLGAPAQRVRASGGGRVLAVGDVSAWAEAIADIASRPEQVKVWQGKLTLPSRVEEEAFFYESLYRRLVLPT